MTGVGECSQQRGNLKDDGYILVIGLTLSFFPPCLINLQPVFSDVFSSNVSMTSDFLPTFKNP
ncbi:hypothetical protein [Photorhabdus laumondii]|uniref:hypothetical protein n=1 Tax=Photorhabdus laumondii TaxID=2218628 RepID=UPI0033151006